MTHTTRIPVSDQLEQAYANARTAGSVRYLKVLIQNESLVSVYSHPLGSVQSDWSTLADHLEPKKPCYLLFRLDSTNTLGYEWVLLSFVPDGSPVYDRMLYASTRDPLKKQLGLSYFADTLHGSEKSDFTWEAYQSHKDKHLAPAPYTAAEMQYKNETSAEIDHGTAREYVHSVKFPLSDDAKSALRNFSSSNNFVQLKVDPTRETIELVKHTNLSSIDGLLGTLDQSEPRFTFYKYEHDYEGDAFDSNLFIYSCPENSPIKLKMLYSTVKSVVSNAAEEAGLKVDRAGKLEVTDFNDFSVEGINAQLHFVAEKVERFNRPMRPGRGKPRMTRGK